MPRKAAKTLDMTPREFVPKSHREDQDLDINAAAIESRPMVFVGRPPTREEVFRVGDTTDLKGKENLTPEDLRILRDDNASEEDKRKVMLKVRTVNEGEALKYLFFTLISEIRNVLLDGEKIEVLKKSEIGRLWSSTGAEEEIQEACDYFFRLGKMEDTEAKNSN